MAKYFLVTVLKDADVAKFQAQPDPELVGWTPAVVADHNTEQDIVENLKQQGLTVIGLESIELLQQKINLVEDFKIQFKDQIAKQEADGTL